MQKRKRHSKFRNTGILFELLTKQITADIIAGKDNSNAKDILFKYFKESTELGKECRLYTTLLNEKLKDETKAERLFSVILEARKRLNNKELTRLKYELIKEIKDKYPLEELLKTPIKNYKIHASIFKIFEDVIASDSKFVVNEVFQAKNCIIENLINKPKPTSENDESLTYFQKQSEEIRLLTYKLLIEKLNEKYSSELDDEQKSILREYICNVSNTNKFDLLVKSKVTYIKEELSKILKNNGKIDSVIKIKLNEVINQLDKITPAKVIKDNHVMVLMLSYELLKECKKILTN